MSLSTRARLVESDVRDGKGNPASLTDRIKTSPSLNRTRCLQHVHFFYIKYHTPFSRSSASGCVDPTHVLPSARSRPLFCYELQCRPQTPKHSRFTDRNFGVFLTGLFLPKSPFFSRNLRVPGENNKIPTKVRYIISSPGREIYHFQITYRFLRKTGAFFSISNSVLQISREKTYFQERWKRVCQKDVEETSDVKIAVARGTCVEADLLQTDFASTRSNYFELSQNAQPTGSRR